MFSLQFLLLVREGVELPPVALVLVEDVVPRKEDGVEVVLL